MKRVPLIVLWLTFVCAGAALAQTETGYRLARNYPSEVYDAGTHESGAQNWDVAQDRRGVLYFGNSTCVLEYDGVRWRKIKVANSSTVRSLAVDEAGRVFVGAQDDLGYLSPDERGQMQYRSLVDRLPDDARQFANVWRILVVPEGVLFQSNLFLFLWDGISMHVAAQAPKENSFHTSFFVNDKVYVRQRNVGLLEYAGGQLRMVPGGERFAKLAVYVMLPADDGRLLIATYQEGLELYDGRQSTPFGVQANPWFVENRVYHGCTLPDGRWAIATTRGGVAVVNRAGEIEEIYDRERGIQSESVWAVFPDAQGGLWLALDKGVVGLVFKLINEPPPSLRAYVSSIPPAVEDVVIRALHKTPSMRPTATELAELFIRAVEQAPEFAREASDGEAGEEDGDAMTQSWDDPLTNQDTLAKDE